MSRVGTLLAVILLAAPVAGGADQRGGILFSLARPARGGIVLVRPDGVGFVDLTSNEVGYESDVRSYSWSPDGSRVVFASHRDGPSSTEIYVMNADGSGQRRLTFDSGHDSIFDVLPAWSPDGGTIAFVQDRNQHDSIRLMNPDGAAQRELVNVGAVVRHLLWSPDSTRLLYDVANAPPARVDVVDVRTGSWRTLTPPARNDFDPSWSPDGRFVALTTNEPPGENHIAVVDATTSSRRTLSVMPGMNAAWSPDGTRIAFAGVRKFPEYADRYGAPQRIDLYVAGSDGSDVRRLTGPFDESAFGRAPGASEPTWWPDGSRLFFRSGEGPGPATTYVVNADGSCEQRFGPGGDPLLYPAWQPVAASLPALTQCADLRLSVDGPSDAVGLRARVPFSLVVENDGNVTATGVRLEITFPPSAEIELDRRLACSREPALVCTVPSLAPQTAIALDLGLSSARAGLVQATFTVRADQPDESPMLNTLVVSETVLPCRTVGTKAADDLRGTNRSDSICSRGGADRVEGLAGNDYLDSAAGDDTVIGGAGRDRITAGDGSDVILVRDGRRDLVTCGAGRDVVLADRLDSVAADCERVLRR